MVGKAVIHNRIDKDGQGGRHGGNPHNETKGTREWVDCNEKVSV